ncbi:VOC family protein, partial [Streptomyces bottropensis]|uniref:VOC family protein n=1 Tax=Streptomyces bottropensis TaxID=42235 RepID=UPI0036B7E8A8
MAFPFGQPIDAVIQFAYTVPDLAAEMRWWTDELGVGPWFVSDRIDGEGSTYRGEPGRAEFALALAFSGHTMVELIQTLDDEPSIYKEALRTTRLRLPPCRRGRAERHRRLAGITRLGRDATSAGLRGVAAGLTRRARLLAEGRTNAADDRSSAAFAVGARGPLPAGGEFAVSGRWYTTRR